MSSMIRLDKIGAKAHIVNFTFDADLDNARIVALGDLLADGEGYVADEPADVTADRMVLHASVAMDVMEDKFEEDYVLPTGAMGRGYILSKGDIITVTDDAISGTTVKGQFCIPENTKSTFKASATAPVDGTLLVFKVIDKGTLGVNATAASVLEVIKA